VQNSEAQQTHAKTVALGFLRREHAVDIAQS